MKINRNSWLYKIYKATYWLSDKRIPDRTNLCQYVRRLILGTIFILGIGTPIGVLFYSIVFLFITIRYVPFGRRPRSFNLDPEDIKRTFVPYRPARIGKISFYPWHVVVILLLGYLFYQYSKIALMGISGLIGIVGIILLFVLVFKTAKEWEIWRLIGAYLKAKKQKACPLIEFEDGVSTQEE